MFGSKTTLVSGILLAAALTLLTPAVSQAAPRGGVRGGFQPAVRSGVRGGFNPALRTRVNPGFNRGFYGGGYRPYYSGWGYGAASYGSTYSYPAYGYSPYTYGYSPYANAYYGPDAYGYYPYNYGTSSLNTSPYANAYYGP
jgi:hypothetical protein